MLPSRYRARLVGNPVNACSLKLTVQASSVGDRLAPKHHVDSRLNKEHFASHSKSLHGDADKNFLSKPEFISNEDPIRYSVPRITAGELPSHFQASMKYKTRQGSHSAVPSSSHTVGNMPCLPGDQVIFSESSSIPGIPVVYRTAEEREENADRLNLDRRRLTVCPILEGEQQLRLLNFQHNLITEIQHLSNLRRLIFLDLYNNHIEEISGLFALKSLRVLMLGKNRIKHISNLESQTNLDVLDLHGNQICKIENLNHLAELRVLNLAGNLIVRAENVTGLDSLTELNLRRNQIEFVSDADTLPCLQRLFLSFNNISSVEDIVCLADSLSLSEVTLDGNPIAQEPWYRPTVLRHMLQLRYLDMKKITEEERRVASVMARKEEEKKREIHKQAILKEKRRQTINNAARRWEVQHGYIAKSQQDAQAKAFSTDITIHKACHVNGNGHDFWPDELSTEKQQTSKETTELQQSDSSHSERTSSMRSPDSLLPSAVQGLSFTDSHLTELEGDTLCLYGSGALDSLDRSWGVQMAGAVTTISFTFIDFDEIVPVLFRLRIKFPNIMHFKFQHTNIQKLQQFNALAQLRRLDMLTINPQGNPVVNFSLWKYYVLFRLNHFGLQKINDIEVSPLDLIMSERIFGILGHMAACEIPQTRLLSLVGEMKRKQLQFLMEAKGRKAGTSLEESKDNGKLGGESMGRAVLNYTIRDSGTEHEQCKQERKCFCQKYVQSLVKEASLIDQKNESLQKLWPQIFIELVRDCVIEMRNKTSYMQLCLTKIMDQK
ncbi:leucine-rich repeat-containing protein 49 isoform X1 [Callorhinchus milii]|nr:leucine-rich repeat-containing protein 49 isoform X1 [Callorhinchus milii]